MSCSTGVASGTAQCHWLLVIVSLLAAWQLLAAYDEASIIRSIRPQYEYGATSQAHQQRREAGHNITLWRYMY